MRQARTKEPRNKNRQNPTPPQTKHQNQTAHYDTAKDTRPRKYWYWLIFPPPRDSTLVHTATNILLLAQLLLPSPNSNGLHRFENTGARFSFCHRPGAVYWYWSTQSQKYTGTGSAFSTAPEQHTGILLLLIVNLTTGSADPPERTSRIRREGLHVGRARAHKHR